MLVVLFYGSQRWYCVESCGETEHLTAQLYASTNQAMTDWLQASKGRKVRQSAQQLKGRNTLNCSLQWVASEGLVVDDVEQKHLLFAVVPASTQWTKEYYELGEAIRLAMWNWKVAITHNSFAQTSILRIGSCLGTGQTISLDAMVDEIDRTTIAGLVFGAGILPGNPRIAIDAQSRRQEAVEADCDRSTRSSTNVSHSIYEDVGSVPEPIANRVRKSQQCARPDRPPVSY